MKCHKCGAHLPFGTYGQVKCEYCGTVNNVPTPEQERGEKIEIEKRNQNITLIFIALIIIGGLILMKGFDSGPSTTTPLTTTSASTTFSPPATTRAPTMTAPPTTTHAPTTTPAPTTTTPPTTTAPQPVCEWIDPYYYIEWGAWGTGKYENIDVIITNEEDQSITVKLTIGFFVGGNLFSDGLERDRTTKSITLDPNERKTVNFQWDVERNVYFDGNAIIIDERADRIEKCETR